MKAVLYKFPSEPWVRLGGMTVFERNLRSLGQIGISKAQTVLPPGEVEPPLSIPRPLAIELEVDQARLPQDAVFPSLRALLPGDFGPLILFHANLLIDPRILTFLANSPSPSLYLADPCAATGKCSQIAVLETEDLERPEELLRIANVISRDDINSYDTEVRGEVEPYCLKIVGPDTERQGLEVLIRRSQKRPGDFIEKHIHPDIQNWMVRKICDGAITPNQISLIVVIFSVAGAILFYQGSFLIAWILAFSATVLDGVDGKLARVKMMTSRIGKLEHIFDYFGENSWYLCLAGYLAPAFGTTAWYCGFAITACDTTDRIIAALFEKRMNITLDEYSPFDRDFRLIGGRKTIYLFFFLIGFFAASLYAAFKLALAWAIFTVLIHAARTVLHLRRGARKSDGSDTINELPN